MVHKSLFASWYLRRLLKKWNNFFQFHISFVFSSRPSFKNCFLWMMSFKFQINFTNSNLPCWFNFKRNVCFQFQLHCSQNHCVYYMWAIILCVFVDTSFMELRANDARGWWKSSARPVLGLFGKVSHILHPGADMLTYPSTVLSYGRLSLLSRNTYHIPRVITCYFREPCTF